MPHYALKHYIHGQWPRLDLVRFIERGQKLETRELESFLPPDSLESYKEEIEAWLKQTSEHIRKIYDNESIVEECCKPIGELDLRNIDRLKGIETLKQTIRIRIEALESLVRKTWGESAA